MSLTGFKISSWTLHHFQFEKLGDQDGVRGITAEYYMTVSPPVFTLSLIPSSLNRASHLRRVCRGGRDRPAEGVGHCYFWPF